MTNETKSFYEFGPYRIDPAERLFFREAKPVPLPPKVFETLLILVNHSERVVLKDDLMKSLWPETFVEEANLSQNIFILRKALGESAQDPRYIVTVPGRGYRFAQKVSQVAVEPPVDEVVVATHSQVEMTIRDTEATRHGWFAWGGLAAVLLAVGLAGYLLLQRHNRADREPIPNGQHSVMLPRRSVAVLGFSNLSGHREDAWLSVAFAEMLNTELAAGEKLRLIPGEDVARAKLEMHLGDTGSLSKDTLAHLRKKLSTDIVVLGSFTALKDTEKRIRLDLCIQDANAGETAAEISATGTEADIFELVSQAGARLREKLGVGAVTLDDAVRVRASLPGNPEAARLYARGLERLRDFDGLTARDLLEGAVTADPNYPLAHSALAAAWTALGNDKNAKKEATRAFQLSSRLTREERMYVEGRYRSTIGDYGKAVEVYRALFTLFPDNLDYGLHLAEAQEFAGHPADAVATLETLGKLPPPLGDDPEIDLRLASAISESDHAKALAADERAIAKGTALGANLLVARARGNQCANRVEVGQLAAAIEACEQSRQLYAAAGDMYGVGKELNDIAYIDIEQGNLPEAKKLFNEALQKFRDVGNDEATAAAMSNLAGMVYFDGNLVEAKRLFRESVPRYRKVEDTDGEALVLVNLAEVQTDEGDLLSAKATYQQALAIAQRTSDKRAEGYVWAGMGDPFLRAGDLAAARKAYEQSLRIRDEIGEKQTATESRTYLAALSIEEGHPAAAEKSARECLTAFRSGQQDDDELTAATVLVESLLAQGKFVEAQAFVEAESTLAAKSQNYIVAPKFAIVGARVLAASGKVAEARSRLQSILREAIRNGFVEYQFETRLALGRIDIMSGNPGLGIAHLKSVEANAKTRGYELLARKAIAARR
jgi:DNA-binding winged helix-turn-helix (wHTH) protein/tetratricopeptide (TPR) repeat protein